MFLNLIGHRDVVTLDLIASPNWNFKIIARLCCADAGRKLLEKYLNIVLIFVVIKRTQISQIKDKTFQSEITIFIKFLELYFSKYHEKLINIILIF